MTADLYSSWVVPRHASSQSPHCWFSASHTCSIVTSGFSPPQPLRLVGDEGQGHQAQRQVAHQCPIVPPLEVTEANLALAHPEVVFHVPAAEAHLQQPPQRRPRRRVGHEVLLFPCPDVPCPDQPEGPLAPELQPYPRRLRLPRLRGQRLPLQMELLPRLLREQRAVPHQIIGPAGAAAMRPRGAAAERLGHFADVREMTLLEPLQKAGLVAVALIERQPVETNPVSSGPVELFQGD